MLLLDETSISGTINIFKEYLKKLELDNITITNKNIICKRDFLMVHNITKAIYQQQDKKHSIHQY